MRLFAFVWLVASASAADAIDASPEALPVAETSLVESVAAVSCRANTYYWGAYQGRHYCVKCPADTISNGCNNCNKDPKHRACYKPLACPKGKFADKGGIVCTECPAGKWQSKASKDKCWDCPSGKFQPKSGLHGCYKCAVGKYADAAGSTACTKCDSCKKGKYGTTADEASQSADDCKCEKCLAGKFAPAQYTTCFDCPAGRYQPEDGSFSCYYCPIGKFQAAAGNTECNACAVGTTTPTKGSKIDTDCKQAGEICPQGEYRAPQNDGTIKCDLCPMGKYGEMLSSSYGGHCYNCDAGRYQDIKGMHSCKKCENDMVPSADRKSCTALPTYEVHFRLFNYQTAAPMLSKGWKLLDLKDAVALKDLIFGTYKQDKGFEVLGSWQTSSCCITLAKGYRMTANGVSFVYPMDSTASSLKCSSTMNYYTSAHKMRLAFHNGNNMAELTGANKIGGAVGSGLCAKKAGENNPGIYMGRTYTTKTYAADRCQKIGSERLCLAAPPTQAPTQAPTQIPTTEPTMRPTSEPTPFVTDAAPQHCPTVNCQQDTPEGCTRHFVHQYDEEHCPVYPCGKLDCTTQQVIDCQVSDWGNWTACDKTCGTGHERRHRTVVQEPRGSGAVECPILEALRSCRIKHCPVDCSLSSWGQWGACSATCGDGVQRRHRDVISENQHGGSCNVADLLDTKPCQASGTCAPTKAPTGTPTGTPTMQPTAEPTMMPVDCKFEYGRPTNCSKPCGGGTRTRNLIVLTEAAFGGAACPAETTSSEPCNEHTCPTHCEVSDWGEYTECSKTCGFGTQDRFRNITKHPRDGGIGCPELYQRKSCEWIDCPVHCVVDSWNAWGRCSAGCGEGVKQRTRNVVEAAEFGGTECPSLIDTESCFLEPCPVNCQLGPWNAWSTCDHTCGVGEKSRTRSVTTPAAHEGLNCQGNCVNGLCTEIELCHEMECPPVPVDCEAEAWGTWSPCSQTCGVGNHQWRSRGLTTHAKHGGNDNCTIYEENTENCEQKPCPVDCEVWSWDSWNTCSATCGGGTRVRTRRVKVQASEVPEGKQCPQLEQIASCHERQCAHDCDVSSWVRHGECSKSCGSGEQKRVRSILINATIDGKPCPALEETHQCKTESCPIDCAMSEWSNWTACDKTCSSVGIYGRQKRTRAATTAESHGGKGCGAVFEEQECNSFLCPIDCVVDSFNDWSECSVSCGKGFEYRTRPILRESDNGGQSCPDLLESRKCSMSLCTVDCEVTKWSQWSECAKSCGTGFEVRTRTVVKQNGHPMNCPSKEQTRTCATNVCPVDCKMTDWEDWSPCSKSCDGGEKKRRRSVDVPAAYGGKPCGALQEQAGCYTEACPVDCTVRKWGAWPSCSKTCGSGWTTRKRKIKDYPQNGGSMCPRLDESRQCNEGECPVHCDVSKWNEWSECSKTCGGGVMSRSRSVLAKAANGGYKCPLLKLEIKCNTHACPDDCELSVWGEWGACDKTCGQGYKQRLRSIVTHPTAEGKPCLATSETEACNTQKCAISCKYTKWTAWEECSKSCGTGHQSHRRNILIEAAYGGIACDKLQVTKKCNLHACPINCVTSGWSEWTECTHKCGGGKKTRSRKVVQEPAFGGWKCPVLEQEHSCNQSPCALNCEVGSWGMWGECTKSCGIGASTRVRQVISHAHTGEWVCPHLSQTQACNEHECPADCEVSKFTEWGECDKSCGGGIKKRKRVVLKEAVQGGAPCRGLSETKECNNKWCPQDCEVSEFEPWTTCDKTCDGGSQSRSRVVQQKSKRGGKSCPVLNEARKCNTGPCPVNCKVSAFVSWSPCSTTCGWGTETRTRIVKREAAHGGKPCPDIHETRACQEKECPVVCKMSGWGPWSTCDKSCGRGQQVHERTILSNAKASECPSTTETRECNSHECPKDCHHSDYLPWSSCSATCGGGTQNQYRVVISPALYGGKKCGSLTQVQACNTQECPVNCELAPWAPWDGCSKTCGHGHQRRERQITTEAKYNGAKCGDTFMTRSCNAGPCPSHCEVSSWSEFGECSRTCSEGRKIGKKKRTRHVISHEQNGGYTCPSLQETTECNTNVCPVDCQVTGWSAFDLCDKECGTGRKYRTRVVVTHPVAQGKECPELKDSAACDAGPCAINCEVTEWGDWSACNQTCTDSVNNPNQLGHMHRSRTIQNKKANGVCPLLKQIRQCNVAPCPINCVVSDWKNWNGCSKSCGTGEQSRKRKITTQPMFEGQECPPLKETRECETQHCPVDCGVTDFEEWSACSKTCGGGNKRRQRHITGQTQMYGGKSCPHMLEHSTCNNHPCPVDCKMSNWGPFSDCSVTCGHGTQTRARSVSSVEHYGGSACGNEYETAQCNLGHCPNHCQVTKFGPWSACSKTCGVGKRTRTRTIIKHGAAGYECPALEEKAACSVLPCDVDCVVSKFNKWTPCSRSCNTGFRTRDRVVITEPKHNGKPCPYLRQAQTCKTEACPVDCQMSHWSAWGECGVTCSKGVQKRSRKQLHIATHGGKDCELSRGLFYDQHRECDAGPCPVGCTVTSWGEFGDCTQTCGTGLKVRRRTVTWQSTSPGSVCPMLEQTKECNTEHCAIDCVVSNFGKWSTCDRTCGGGMQYRERRIITQPNHLGKPCQHLHSSRVCGKNACPVDCKVGSLSAWTVCDKSCGGGTRHAKRKIKTQPVFGGKACPSLILSERCNAQPCPVNCKATRWSKWSTCVKSSVDKCARAKFRHVTREAAFGGKQCAAVSDKWEQCPESECANLTDQSCSHVKCIYYKESGVGHIRVYHDNGEQKGNKHVCKHIGATCQCDCHSESA